MEGRRFVPQERGQTGRTPLHTAAYKGDLRQVEELLQRGAQLDAPSRLPSDNGRQALHLAALGGHRDVVNKLLQIGANPDAADHQGFRPLHIAAQHGAVNIVQRLHQANVSLETLTKAGWQAVHLAAGGGHVAVLQLLQEYHCNLAPPDASSARPLHHAASSGHLDAVRWLIKAGVPVNVKDKEGRSAADRAKEENHHDIYVELSAAEQRSATRYRTGKRYRSQPDLFHGLGKPTVEIPRPKTSDLPLESPSSPQLHRSHHFSFQKNVKMPHTAAATTVTSSTTPPQDTQNLPPKSPPTQRLPLKSPPPHIKPPVSLLPLRQPPKSPPPHRLPPKSPPLPHLPPKSPKVKHQNPASSPLQLQPPKSPPPPPLPPKSPKLQHQPPESPPLQRQPPKSPSPPPRLPPKSPKLQHPNPASPTLQPQPPKSPPPPPLPPRSPKAQSQPSECPPPESPQPQSQPEELPSPQLQPTKSSLPQPVPPKSPPTQRLPPKSPQPQCQLSESPPMQSQPLESIPLQPLPPKSPSTERAQAQGTQAPQSPDVLPSHDEQTPASPTQTKEAADVVSQEPCEPQDTALRSTSGPVDLPPSLPATSSTQPRTPSIHSTSTVTSVSSTPSLSSADLSPSPTACPSKVPLQPKEGGPVKKGDKKPTSFGKIKKILRKFNSDPKIPKPDSNVNAKEVKEETAGDGSNLGHEEKGSPLTSEAPTQARDGCGLGTAEPNNPGEPRQQEAAFLDLVVQAASRPFTEGPDVYPCTSNPRGIVIILNNKSFHDRPDLTRYGSECDTRNLEDVFHKMGYDVRTRGDLTRRDTLDWFQKVSKLSMLQSVSCLFVFILSHGEGRKVFCTYDNQTVSLDEVQSCFLNQSCPGLKGKPKVFFSHFCRGADEETQSQLSADATREAYKDMLCLYSSTEGFQALRHHRLGTPSVRALCRTLARHAHCKHFRDIVQEFQKLYETLEGATSPEVQDFKFKKDFYLNPTGRSRLY